VGALATHTARTSKNFVRLSRLAKLSRCEQVAAVCYRIKNGGIEFLLVRTSGGQRWTFPKGSAERGLTGAQAAALEAFEEAGVHGRIEELAFANYRRRVAGRASEKSGIRIQAYLCEVRRLSPAKEAGRNRTWFGVEACKAQLREARDEREAGEFVRVIDRAVARIQTSATQKRDEGTKTRPETALRPDKKDALQQVKFDFAEACGPLQSYGSGTNRSNGSARRDASLPNLHRASVDCEILEFQPPRKRLPN
jgi:8-oxo-dGTP pyrophosphatase MutT (NUDIX family)